MVLQVKETGKGASREEAQQQAAKKVNNSFHFNGSSSSITKRKTKSKEKAEQQTHRQTEEKTDQKLAKTFLDSTRR